MSPCVVVISSITSFLPFSFLVKMDFLFSDSTYRICGEDGRGKKEDTGKMAEVVFTVASGEIMTELLIWGQEPRGETVQKDLG